MTSLSSEVEPNFYTKMDNRHEVLVKKVCKIYDKLFRLENLNPSNQVNDLFTQLVTTCTTPHHIMMNLILLNYPQEIKGKIAKLITLCGKAEGLLESHYSTLIGSNEKPLNQIKIFPYYKNYLKLTHLEFTMLTKHIPQAPSKLAFIGSGPLPLTSIMLATYYLTKTCFHNYDINLLANSKAYDLISKDNDLSKRMFFHTSDIFDIKYGLKDYSVVFLAALVGMDKKEKEKVINHLAKYMAPNAIRVLRSAHGARAFLYPIVDPCSDLKGYEVLSIFHPTDEVINSVIVARKCLVNQQGINYLKNKCCEVEGFNPLSRGNVVDELSIDDQA